MGREERDWLVVFQVFDGAGGGGAAAAAPAALPVATEETCRHPYHKRQHDEEQYPTLEIHHNIISRTNRMAKATPHATAHCHTTIATAWRVLNSFRTVAIVATHGV